MPSVEGLPRYDFTGNVLRTKEWQTIGSTTTTVEQHFTYDDRGRLLTSKLKVNDGPEITTSELSYDELGRLKTRKLHGGIENLTCLSRPAPCVQKTLGKNADTLPVKDIAEIVAKA